MARETYTIAREGADASTQRLANVLGVGRRTLGAYDRDKVAQVLRPNVQGAERIGNAIDKRRQELYQQNDKNNGGNYKDWFRNEKRINVASTRMISRLWKLKK